VIPDGPRPGWWLGPAGRYAAAFRWRVVDSTGAASFLAGLLHRLCLDTSCIQLLPEPQPIQMG